MVNDLGSIKERYDAISETYDELYGEEQRAKYESLLRRINLRVGKLLDAGGGSLLFEKYLLRGRGPQGLWIVALDISKIIVRPYNELMSLPSIDAVIGDILNLPLRGNAFDFVFCITVLGGFGENLEEAIESLLMARREHGLTVITLHRKTIGPRELELFARLCRESWEAGSDVACVV